MVTPVGGTALQTVNSIRAGISRYAERPLDDSENHAIVMALLPDDWLPALSYQLEDFGALTEREKRMLRLAGPALREAVKELPSTHALALDLALPETPERVAPPAGDSFLRALSIQSGVDLDIRASRVFLGGRAAGLQALGAAMARARDTFTLVGGVDSYLDPEVLTVLEMEGRLLKEDAMDAFAPGEGAGFLLLGSAAKNDGPLVAAVVHEPGFGREPGHRDSDEPYRGDGLAAAIAAALGNGAARPIETVVCSLNGENLGAKEWGVSLLRNRRFFQEDVRIWHPADCFGDTGAAMGPLLLGFAALGLKQGHVKEPCIVWCSSDGELRGAVCVSAVPAKEA